MRQLTAAAMLLALLLGCSSGPPARYVVEKDLGNYAYRRYQKVVDVEFPIAGNEASGHTAHYVERQGRKVSVASAFVTVYDEAASLTAEVRRQLDDLATYEVDVREVEGDWVWSLDGGTDRWLLWVANNRVVKLGAPQGGEVPDAIAEKYLDIYPSDLNEHGRAREDAPSAGEAQAKDEAGGDGAPPMPSHLKEEAPK